MLTARPPLIESEYSSGLPAGFIWNRDHLQGDFGRGGETNLKAEHRCDGAERIKLAAGGAAMNQAS
jgi:hypothetical protein